MASAKQFLDLPVRVVPTTGLDRAALVRPDGYVAGRSAPDEQGERHLVSPQGLRRVPLGALRPHQEPLGYLVRPGQVRGEGPLPPLPRTAPQSV